MNANELIQYGCQYCFGGKFVSHVFLFGPCFALNVTTDLSVQPSSVCEGERSLLWMWC